MLASLPWLLTALAAGALITLLVGQRLGLGVRPLAPADTIRADSTR